MFLWNLEILTRIYIGVACMLFFLGRELYVFDNTS